MDADQAKFLDLMRRYVELGVLLDAQDVEADDPGAVANARLVLAEMQQVRAEMDAILDKCQA